MKSKEKEQEQVKIKALSGFEYKIEPAVLLYDKHAEKYRLVTRKEIERDPKNYRQ